MMTTEEYNDKPTGSSDGRTTQMTDLIPRDAAIMAIIKQIGEGTEQWVQGNNSAVYACRASLRTIPAVDPAAIREAALRETADSLRGMADFCKLMGDLAGATALYSAATALIGEKK